MGVRLALGARPARLLGTVVRQGMTTAGWGVALGLGASIRLSRFLSSQLFEVNPADPALVALLSSAHLGGGCSRLLYPGPTGGSHGSAGDLASRVSASPTAFNVL